MRVIQGKCVGQVRAFSKGSSMGSTLGSVRDGAGRRMPARPSAAP